jgi:hypothetical protein
LQNVHVFCQSRKKLGFCQVKPSSDEASSSTPSVTSQCTTQININVENASVPSQVQYVSVQTIVPRCPLKSNTPSEVPVARFAALVHKILFSPLKDKSHIFVPPCNILYIYNSPKTLHYEIQLQFLSYFSYSTAWTSLGYICHMV